MRLSGAAVVVVTVGPGCVVEGGGATVVAVEPPASVPVVATVGADASEAAIVGRAPSPSARRT
ncbi:MAG TPA: hypothetical protein VM942_02745 [Acidimicrobiales bacterium]|nr:hypothetical protein [Acidimicrobiales bacterium]